jgi:hypothetical protein
VLWNCKETRKKSKKQHLLSLEIRKFTENRGTPNISLDSHEAMVLFPHFDFNRAGDPPNVFSTFDFSPLSRLHTTAHNFNSSKVSFRKVKYTTKVARVSSRNSDVIWSLLLLKNQNFSKLTHARGKIKFSPPDVITIRCATRFSFVDCTNERSG